MHRVESEEIHWDLSPKCPMSSKSGLIRVLHLALFLLVSPSWALLYVGFSWDWLPPGKVGTTSSLQWRPFTQWSASLSGSLTLWEPIPEPDATVRGTGVLCLSWTHQVLAASVTLHSPQVAGGGGGGELKCHLHLIGKMKREHGRTLTHHEETYYKTVYICIYLPWTVPDCVLRGLVSPIKTFTCLLVSRKNLPCDASWIGQVESFLQLYSLSVTFFHQTFAIF